MAQYAESLSTKRVDRDTECVFFKHKQVGRI